MFRSPHIKKSVWGNEVWEATKSDRGQLNTERRQIDPKTEAKEENNEVIQFTHCESHCFSVSEFILYVSVDMKVFPASLFSSNKKLKLWFLGLSNDRKKLICGYLKCIGSKKGFLVQWLLYSAVHKPPNLYLQIKSLSVFMDHLNNVCLCQSVCVM